MPKSEDTIVIEPVTEIPTSASICHFDEIHGRLQEKLIEAHRQPQGTRRSFPVLYPAEEDRECDIVKFTEYYRIRRE